MTKQSLFQLLADNQIETLFQALKGSNSKYLNDLILLESQWSDLRAKERNGIISSEQSNLELARIRKNLLELIERSFSVSATVALPSSQTTGASNRKWMLLGAVSIVLAIALFAFSQSLPNTSSTAESAGAKSDAPAIFTSGTSRQKTAAQTRMLEVPANRMTFNKGRVGDITYQFMSAELSEQNTDTWLLRLKIRGIKPAYGFRISGSQLHISYGDFEKGPVSNSFEYINPGETAEGVVEFEIPKAYKDAQLLIYHYSDEPPLATIPFKW